MLLYVHRGHRDGEPRMVTQTFTLLLRYCDATVQCCFTSTETIRTVRDGEPRTATSAFAQFLSSDIESGSSSSMLLYVHRDRTDC